MNSPGAGGVGPESFFSPGQAERGQAGAGRAAARVLAQGVPEVLVARVRQVVDLVQVVRVKVVIRCRNRTRGRTGQVTETLCNLIL